MLVDIATNKKDNDSDTDLAVDTLIRTDLKNVQNVMKGCKQFYF